MPLGGPLPASSLVPSAEPSTQAPASAGQLLPRLAKGAAPASFGTILNTIMKSSSAVTGATSLATSSGAGTMDQSGFRPPVFLSQLVQSSGAVPAAPIQSNAPANTPTGGANSAKQGADRKARGKVRNRR